MINQQSFGFVEEEHPKKIVLVVHGRTIENDKGIHQGWSVEGTLSRRGILESRLLSEALKNEGFDHALSSPLKRCTYTYNIIKEHHPRLELTTTDRLRAKKSGLYEGKDGKLVYEILDKLGIPLYEFIPEGGESTKMQQERVVDFFDNSIPRLPYTNLLIVTHGGIITTLGLNLFNLHLKDYNQIQPTHASISRLEYSNGEYKVVEWNKTDHLKKG